MNNNLNYATAVKSQHSVVSRLQYLTWGEFSGTLSVTSESGQSWELLFYQGQMVWGTDRAQPNRFWQRHITSQLPHRQNVLQTLSQALDRVQPKVLTPSLGECWPYQGLLALLELAKIDKEDLVAIITAVARELLFDLLQANHRETLTFQSQVARFIEQPMVSIGIQKVLEEAQADWREWRKQRLTIINPSKAPVIRQTVELYRQTTPTIYQNLARVITGNLTFREIATTINQDLLLLTRSLSRYIKNGIIELVDLPDINIPTPSAKDFNLHPSSSLLSSLSSTLKPSGKLVACIDDNPQICELMKVIVTDAGYRFIAIQDATQALSRLLESKPDIIFLDLMMPQINGYEVCSQIRKISSLNHIPVVILTGKDGLMDRVRAKVTGSTDFITKPIDRQKINTAIDRYIGMINSDSKVPN
jgi:chemotaxis family two-component system response regulator PixG